MTQSRRASGFSLVELIVTLAIVLAVTGAVFALTHHAHAVFLAEPARADMQQRLRIAVEAISRDLIMAGAGGVPAIQPLRRGLLAPDPPGTFFDDRISIMYVPHAAPQTELRQPTASTVMVLVAPQTGCPTSNPLCGFKVNQLISIYDETGAYDTFRLQAVQNDPPALAGDGSPLSKTYAEGAIVAGMEAATYWLKSDPGANVHQLMRYDGQQTDAPVAENILGLRFEYFGEPRPPAIVHPLSAARGPWTSYGPKPPDVDIDDASTPGYGPGENCAFTVDHGATVARPEMLDLGSSSTSPLVPLGSSRLVDGPWCPDVASPVRFDADLMRIRQVRVTLRVGSGRRLLLTPIPDISITFDIGPRNLER